MIIIVVKAVVLVSSRNDSISLITDGFGVSCDYSKCGLITSFGNREIVKF